MTRLWNCHQRITTRLAGADAWRGGPSVVASHPASSSKSRHQGSNDADVDPGSDAGALRSSTSEASGSRAVAITRSVTSARYWRRTRLNSWNSGQSTSSTNRLGTPANCAFRRRRTPIPIDIGHLFRDRSKVSDPGSESPSDMNRNGCPL